MGETVLVTGGSGFVASWCIVTLLQRGFVVRATLRSLSREAEIRAALAAAAGAVANDTEQLRFVVADLSDDAGWDAAMTGCNYVLHVASPMGGRGESLETLVTPARDGTMRVLGAATRAGVARIVTTSSCAAATPREHGRDTSSDETVWTDIDGPNINAYRASKAIAERAAWDWMAANSDPVRLVTILPAAVFGPVLLRGNLGSVAVIGGLLNGRPPGLPRVSFNVVDVRDVAALHIAAMLASNAGGERFIAAGEFMWMKDVASVLCVGLGSRAAKVATWGMPDALVRLAALFVPPLRALTPMIGRRHSFSAAKARRVLGFVPRPAAETIVDCANSLVAA